MSNRPTPAVHTNSTAACTAATCASMHYADEALGLSGYTSVVVV